MKRFRSGVSVWWDGQEYPPRQTETPPGSGVDAGQRGLFEEMTTFPYGDRDDLLDAAATGTAYLLQRREPRIWILGSESVGRHIAGSSPALQPGVWQ